MNKMRNLTLNPSGFLKKKSVSLKLVCKDSDQIYKGFNEPWVKDEI